MHLGHDIWYQVVQYFECQVEDGDEVAERRAALLNLALTSQELSALALAMLWKNMISIRPIVGVINSFALAPRELLLIRTEKSKGYWKLLRRPDDDRIAARVKDYLGHIRLFLVHEDERESALWPILIACFGKETPLLPNVKDLVVFFNSDFPASYNLLPLILPPKLKMIKTLQVGSSPCSTAMLNFYQLLSGCCSLQEVEYFGDPCPYLISTFTLFKNLESLTILHRREIGGRPSPLSLPELLQQLPSLKSLSINLVALATCTATSAPPLEHISLQYLSLYGTAMAFHAFITSNIICPLVQTFLFNIRPGGGWPSWKLLYNGMVSVFPGLSTLRLSALPLQASDVDCPRLVMSDLQRLLPLQMEELTIRGIEGGLVQEDLQVMAKAWPTLRILALPNCETCVAINTVLSELWSPELREVELPLDFTTFASPHHDLPVTRKTKLHQLTVCPPAKLPLTLNEKVSLAWNLLAVCPNLKTVETGDEEIGNEVRDLQEIITGLRSVAAPHRVLM